jgi:hypothetical protein
MYVFIMLDRLQPRYKQAVLALKAGGKIKDPAVIEFFQRLWVRWCRPGLT